MITPAMRKKFWVIRRRKAAARAKLEAAGKPIPVELLTTREQAALRRKAKPQGIPLEAIPDRPAKPAKPVLRVKKGTDPRALGLELLDIARRLLEGS